MRKLVVAAILSGTLGIAGTGFACPGQCYSADGRPIGAAFAPDRPDREWIRSIVARGGRCTGVTLESTDSYRGFSEYERPNHRHFDWYQRRDRD